MTSKIFASKLKYLLALMIASHIGGCRSNEHSNTNDIGGSPSDFSKPSYVVYIDSHSMVHKGECPATAARFTRDCQGYKDLVTPISKDDYVTGLRLAILSKKAPRDQNSAEILTNKIKRINKKLEEGALAESEQNKFRIQLRQLNKRLLAAYERDFNRDERDRFNLIMNGLKKGSDEIFDEGENNYQLAIAPFSVASPEVKEPPVKVEVFCKNESRYFESAKGGCKDKSTGLVWSQKVATKNRLGSMAYCQNLLVEGDPTLPWRVPTLSEFQQLSQPHKKVQHHFSSERISDKYIFWTSTQSTTTARQGTTKWRFHRQHTWEFIVNFAGHMTYLEESGWTTHYDDEYVHDPKRFDLQLSTICVY